MFTAMFSLIFVFTSDENVALIALIGIIVGVCS